MIGGSKIGGPGGPFTPQTLPTAEHEPAAKTGEPKGAVKESDRFEKASRQAPATPPSPLAAERSASGEAIRLVRDNPAAAKQLMASVAAQVQKNLAKVDQELAGARAALEHLGAQRFAKDALDEKRRALRQKREKIASLKMRIHLSQRKMALLQQIAGQLGTPALEKELDRILNNHAKLSSDWGRRHHLLSLGELLFGGDEDTPAHLREVVKADVRPGDMAEEVGNTIHEISPRRVIAELVARTLDGSVREVDEAADANHAGRRGEHGRVLQSWSSLGHVMTQSLARDPFADKDDPTR